MSTYGGRLNRLVVFVCFDPESGHFEKRGFDAADTSGALNIFEHQVKASDTIGQVYDKPIKCLWRREGLKVPIKQPKNGRLRLNDGTILIF